MILHDSTSIVLNHCGYYFSGDSLLLLRAEIHTPLMGHVVVGVVEVDVSLLPLLSLCNLNKL